MITDEELARSAANGDEGAFAELVKRYLRPIFSFVYRYTESADAEDVSQDVFIRAWRAIESFEPEKRFKTWLFAIAKNAALDWLKRKKPTAFSNFDTEAGENVISDTVPDPSQDPNDLILRIDSREEISRVLGILNPEDRAIVLMRVRDELSFEEIAEVFGKPLNTVKSRYRRAILKVREGGPHRNR